MDGGAWQAPVHGVAKSRRSEERRVGKEWKQCQTLFFWAPKSLQMVTAAMKLKDAYSFQSQRKAMPKNAQITTQLHSSHMLVK